MGAVQKRNVAKIQTTYTQQRDLAELATARKRKMLKRRLFFFMVLAATISYFMISSILSQAQTLDAQAALKKQSDKKLADVKKQHQILKEDIVKLNDDDYIAKLARKEYFLSNKNEIIFTIPDEGKENSTMK